MDVSDTQLTETGLHTDGSSKVLLLACGAIAREVIAIQQANGLTHLDLHCLPAIYHNTPDKITPAVVEAVTAHRDHYDEIFVLYADCGTGGQLQAACDKLGVKMLEGPHCYSFFEGNGAFAARDEMTAFYLTDFLVRQFDAFVWKPLGLDRHPELLEMYFGNYDKLVYQAQTNDPKLTEKAKDCADKMGLNFERRFTAYGDLQKSLIPFENNGL